MDNDESKPEDMPYRAYVLDEIRRGTEEIESGQAIEHEEVKRRLAKWLEE
jgi:predicted transcriptional regulator